LVLSGRKAEALEAMAAELPGEGHSTAPSDLAAPGAAEKLAAEVGAVDILIANAGLPGTGRLPDFSSEELTGALRVNLEAPILMTHALLDDWLARGSGHFVFMSSLNGKVATARASLYSATKFGLRGFSLALREDLRGTPVSSSVVMPGTIREAGMFADSGARMPFGMGTSTPGEVADGVVAAIERDRAEVEVAPRLQRVLTNFAARRPDLAGRIAAWSGAVKVADDVADSQTEKR